MIRRLAPHTIQQIAAGEVVERPASALKELIENAIDAGATKISVSFDQGGLGQIIVEDNGLGISAEDLKLVFEPHATSKISIIDDLERLDTFGFRGEAMAAISSIADIELWTATKDDEIGRSAKVSFGGELKISGADRRCGTKITVRQLFGHTPARLKFMKTPRSESMALQSLFKKYVLGFPSHHFELKDLQYDRQQIWSKQSGIERVLWYFDSLNAEHWLTFESERAGWKVNGWFLRPHHFGSCRSGLVFYFNGRPIRDLKLEFALKRAFDGYSDQMKGLAAVVFLNGPSSEVDVNIHPRKNEVQFKNADAIASLLVKSVRTMLASENRELMVPSVPVLTEIPAPPQTQFSFRPRPHPVFISQEMAASVGEVHAPMMQEIKSRFEFLGDIDSTYLIARLDTKLFLFDQHALHERILYEKLLKVYNEKSQVESQRLLFPVPVLLDSAEILLEKEDLLQRLGFELRLWNDGKVHIVSAPSILKRDHQEVLESLLENYDLPLETILRETLATIACHSAVRAHDRLHRDEIQSLFSQFESQDALGHCPHGRPTFVSLGVSDLERMFHRTQ